MMTDLSAALSEVAVVHCVADPQLLHAGGQQAQLHGELAEDDKLVLGELLDQQAHHVQLGGAAAGLAVQRQPAACSPVLLRRPAATSSVALSLLPTCLAVVVVAATGATVIRSASAAPLGVRGVAGGGTQGKQGHGVGPAAAGQAKPRAHFVVVDEQWQGINIKMFALVQVYSSS